MSGRRFDLILGDPGAPGLDLDAVCQALQGEVVSVDEADLDRFAEVLGALAGTVDANAIRRRGALDRSALPLPDDVQRRLFFACAMIFPDEVQDEVRRFVERNLGPTGLLRLRAK
jgi:hypothetical protein